MDKKYILFDLDGTLTDSSEGIINCVRYALKSFNLDNLDHQTLLRFIGPPLIDAFFEYANMDYTTSKKAVEKYRERYRDIGIFENRVYDGIEDMLKALKQNGKVIILATAKPYPFAVRILDHFKLSKYFDFVFGAEFSGELIHKNQIITHALKNANVTDKNLAVMVGDRAQDILGAKENDIESIGVKYGFAEENELEESGANYIVNTPGDVANLILA